MAVRKKTRRKPARRADPAKAKVRPAKRAPPNKPARLEAAKRGAKKPAAKSVRARARGKRAEAPAAVAGPLAPERATRPSAKAAAPASHPSARGFAQSLALLASEAVRVGVVVHWFARGGVAQLSLEAPLTARERLHVRGATSDFLASATSLRVNGADAACAEAGPATLALPQRARPGDVVYALRSPA